MIFYLKANKLSYYTLNNLQYWINAISLYKEAKCYIICDNELLYNKILEEIDFKELKYMFLQSDKNEKELMKYMAVKKWENAGFAHLTTFIHARQNGFSYFWNIDADDTRFCVSNSRLKEIIQYVEKYCINNCIDLFSLDMWRSRANGMHWSFGVTYTNGNIDWLTVMKNNTNYSGWNREFFYGDKPKNIDEFFTYIKNHNNMINIKTFYFENLQFIHYADDLLSNPTLSGVYRWSNGYLNYPILQSIYGCDSLGKIPIFDDIIKLDVNISPHECYWEMTKMAKYSIEIPNVKDAIEFNVDIRRENIHRMKKMLEKLHNENILVNKKIFIWGNIVDLPNMIEAVVDMGYSVECIIDNNSSYNGQYCNGIEILSPEVIKNYDTSNIVVFVIIKHYRAICNQLKDYGFSGEVIQVLEYVW